MCGLTGFLNRGGFEFSANATATGMADRIRHRGPDDEGVWVDAEAGIALAHRRLSILDLSPAGHQPMSSSSGRWVIAYNGEVYNHLDLRKELKATGAAPPWRGHSDTETLLAGIEAWGIDATLKRCVGMFAFAAWDRAERCLWLARDRIGEKPLYYGWQGDTFLFGSELKALRAHPAFNAGIDRGALALLLRHNHVPAPYSIYGGIRKLTPGTWLRLAPGERDVEPVPFWSLAEVAEHGTRHPFDGTETEALDLLESKLGHAVRSQMMADVPLGALLSGGIDSSTVAALMQKHSGRPVRTFTIGFDEGAYDEANHAHAVAMHLGTEHTELRLTANDALALIPKMPAMYDEPFADSSQMPTHLVMKMARQHVTVALSGDGGDEFFGGYNRYVHAPRVWRRIRRMPSWVRGWLGSSLTSLPRAPLERFVDPLAYRMGVAQFSEKLLKLGMRLREVNSLDDLAVAFVSEWSQPGLPLVQPKVPENLIDDRSRWPRLEGGVARMMALDGLTYLPDDIMVKVDRASMAVSLETRAPFLDREVVGFAWSLPASMKIRDGRGKWLLRQLLYRHVPASLIDRPKMGFSIPLDQWLRGSLRGWAEDLLNEQQLREQGFFDATAIRKTWHQHLHGASFGHRLWSVLMFQAWLHTWERPH